MTTVTQNHQYSHSRIPGLFGRRHSSPTVNLADATHHLNVALLSGLDFEDHPSPGIISALFGPGSRARFPGKIHSTKHPFLSIFQSCFSPLGFRFAASKNGTQELPQPEHGIDVIRKKAAYSIYLTSPKK
jgi:hypothetical protein